VLRFITRKHPTEQVETLLASAGFREPTPLQEEYIPAALMGKDLLVESTPGEGQTVAQIAPYLISPRQKKRGVSMLILVDSSETAGKYEKELRRFTSAKSKGKFAVVLGREEQAKNELRLLSRYPGLIVGTTSRIIDHIRRNNLEFSGEISVVINIPRNSDHIEFDRDVEFIMAKMPEKAQTIVFTSSAGDTENLSYLLKRPAQLSSAERRARLPLLHVFQVPLLNAGSLMSLLYGGEMENTLVLVQSPSLAGELQKQLNSAGLPARVIPPSVEPGRESRNQRTAFRTHLACFDDASGIPFSYDSVIFFGFPSRLSLFQEIGWAVSGRSPEPYFAVLLSPAESDFLAKLQEKRQMKMKNEVPPNQEEILKGKLKSIIHQIKEEEDPDELNRYRKIIRKNVPLHLRSYLTAYLLKKAGGGRLSTGKTPVDKTAEMQTIFVSIGKNRKVFPRDLSRLFQKAADLDPRQIGSIKVLDNYSFIDIPTEAASGAIEKLDGSEFRGRSITVNFARKKKNTPQ